MAPPLPVIKIVAPGEGGRQNPTKDNGGPLSVIKIVKYCGVRGGGRHWGAPKSYKNNSVPHLCRYDSKVFWNRGGALGGAKILQTDNIIFL